jgi:hypothetical protein
MSRIMELHRTIMRAAMDRSITDAEYKKILESRLDEMEKIGISDADMENIEADVLMALLVMAGPIKAVG